MENGNYESTTAKFKLDKDGIIHAIIIKDADLNVENAIENIEIIEKIAAPPRYLFADLRLVNSVTRDLRKYFASEKIVNIIPTRAILVGSPLAKVTGNMILRIMNPTFKVKIFTEEKTALGWLKRIISNTKKNNERDNSILSTSK